MKKTEAISILATSARPREPKDRARYDEAVKMAIEALKCSERTAETAQPDHTADIGKKVFISCGHENDQISRQALYKYAQNQKDKSATPNDIMWFPSAQPELTQGLHNACTDAISRQAAIDALDKRFDDVPMELTTEILQLRHDLRERIPSAQPATNCSEIPNSSDDTISRQVAIEALARMMPRSYTPDGSHPADEEIFRAQEVFADCIEALEILPSAQPEQRWIPVTERLPENDNEVLITVWDAEDDYVEVYKGFYQGHEWWTQWCHGCSKIKDEPCGENIVIAWMPLPEPYRGGET